jgi:glyoxylase-like metal-dependent hydrolase (beta-lactamase superfamily II)
MPDITSRRSLFKLTALGGALLAAPQIMVRAASAQGSETAPAIPGYRRFQIGGFEVTTIFDGGRAGDGPHPTFGADQDAAAVAELLEENFLPTEQFVNGFTPTLVNTGTELVLFDTGLGAGARGNGMGRLRERMQAAGHAPEDVTIVVLTHFHGDHIGGLMEDGAPAFPNARYVMGQAEFDFWMADERLSGPTENAAQGVRANVAPMADNATFLAEGGEVAPGITAMEAFGHTPGHLVFHVESEGQRLLLTADTANHYIVSLQRPGWEVAFDMDKAQAAETRKRVFDMVASDRIPFIGYHMPFPSLGFVEALDTGYRWVPATYQFDV